MKKTYYIITSHWFYCSKLDLEGSPAVYPQGNTILWLVRLVSLWLVGHLELGDSNNGSWGNGVVSCSFNCECEAGSFLNFPQHIRDQVQMFHEACRRRVIQQGNDNMVQAQTHSTPHGLQVDPTFPWTLKQLTFIDRNDSCHFHDWNSGQTFHLRKRSVFFPSLHCGIPVPWAFAG